MSLAKYIPETLWITMLQQFRVQVLLKEKSIWIEMTHSLKEHYRFSTWGRHPTISFIFFLITIFFLKGQIWKCGIFQKANYPSSRFSTIKASTNSHETTFKILGYIQLLEDAATGHMRPITLWFSGSYLSTEKGQQLCKHLAVQCC